VHLLAKNNRKKKEKPNKQMQTILNQLLQLPASDLRFSWRQVQRLLSWMWFSYFTNTSEEYFASKTTSLTTQHHIQEMTCLVHKRNHCSPSKHHYPTFIATSQAFALQSNISVHDRQKYKTCGYKQVGKKWTAQCLRCAFLYIWQVP
jgi:hypothetical protein